MGAAALLAIVAAPAAHADNSRLNNGVIANVYTVQHQAGCSTDIKRNPALTLAAQWHAQDVLNNRALDGNVGSDGSTRRTAPLQPDSGARSPRRSRSTPRWQSTIST